MNTKRTLKLGLAIDAGIGDRLGTPKLSNPHPWGGGRGGMSPRAGENAGNVQIPLSLENKNVT